MSGDGNVWDASGEPRNPEAGLPNVMDLLSKTTALVQTDFPGFLLGGLFPMIAGFIGTFVLLGVIYGAMFVGMIPGLVIEDEGVAVLGGMVSLMLAMVVSIGLLILAVVPMTASVYRAVWRFLVHDEKLTIMAPVSTFTQDLGKVVVFNLLYGFVIFAGVMMCYLPGLVALAALAFAPPAVYIHRLSIGEAISLSMKHAQSNPGWHLGFFAISFVISLVLQYVPFIGVMLLSTVHPLFVLLAYRAVWGDGERPRGF